MDDLQQARRFLRDHMGDALTEEIEALLDMILSLETKVDFTVGYIHRNTQERLERSREALNRVETAIDYLRSDAPKVHDAIMLLIAAAGDLQAEQREIRDSLTHLLKTLNHHTED